DHIYKMDYLKMMEYHIAQKSDLTMSCIDVPIEEASRFGIVDADAHNRVRGFLEKPSDPPEIPSKPGRSFVNMGIYVFNAKALIDTLEEMESKKVMNHDFGKDVIPYMVKNGMPCHAYPFVDENKKEEIYWKDIGTLDSYYDASMDLVSVVPEFNLYDAGWPLRGFQGQSPPAKLVSHGGERVARAFNSLMCDGAVVSGGGVERSIVGANVRINSFADVRDSIIMNNVEIGRNARVRRAIIDKNVVVPEGFEIGYNPDEDRKRFTTSKNGVVVIPKNYVFD
ncbi:MAG: glucose-1-phosphate adenylyltransferase, partial [Ignavibacteriales bacterium]|nr:glucose-1-phosphate adenylyltransferase [Ignavibacteriales bacterium]